MLDNLAGKMHNRAMVSKKKPMTVQEMASMGGYARAKKLSREQRSRIAKKAVAAREAKRARTRAEGAR